jgi:two-component system, OmpR family, copper resistance phosphate regulon response regulator CusR
MHVNVIVVEDESVVQKNLQDHLERNGFNVFSYACAEDAFESGMLANADAVIMDVGLPGMTGLEATQYIKTRFPEIPVIILTAFSEVNHRVQGFEIGADDYIIKPFFVEELMARLKSVLRRYEMIPGSKKTYHIADLTIDIKSKSVFRGNTPIRLSLTEFNLLSLLADSEGSPVSKEDILKKIWKGRYAVSENTVEVYINLLRNKIDRNFTQKLIHTRPGFGYHLGVMETPYHL